jgi:hypothetical protein
MKTRGWPIHLCFLILLTGVAGFLLQNVHVLQIENTDRPGGLLIRAGPPAFFSLSFIHSIYLQPVSEEFEVEKGEEILLRGVRTRSPSVAHYYGFEADNRDYYPVDRRMKSFALRLGMSQAQTLSLGERKISLGNLGEKGDRLEFRVVRMTWGKYLLSRVLKEKS